MLFNSLLYVLLFLPITALAYAAIRRFSTTAAKVFMIVASAYFYVYATYSGAPFLAASCIVSYASYRFILSSEKKKAALAIGVSANVILLCIMKYNHFVPSGTSQVSDWLHIYAMPLAISFFTFQQISFLVDAYRGKIERASVLDYLYYVLFFPKMIAGPITRWNTLMPQTGSREPVKSSTVLLGLSVLSIGLFKKIVLAGLFSRYADVGYANTAVLSFAEAWVTSLSYTAQIYFDFSGYSDIAIGSALLLGIRLPDNFNSPYKAVSIRDFWDRWHISLSTWLRDYVYIPLGGSRKGLSRTLANLIITFLISGAWHGSELNFIIWGLMHGVATCVNVLWAKAGLRMPSLAGWLVTFLFINFSWIPFRAESAQSAYQMVSAMLTLEHGAFWQWLCRDPYNGWHWLKSIFSPNQITTYSAIYSIIALLFIFIIKNTSQMVNSGEVSFIKSSACGIALSISIIFLFGGASAASFIYAAF